MSSVAPGGWRGRMRRIVGGVLFGYLVLVLTVGCVQRSLIYHPPRFDAGEVSAFAQKKGFRPWTNGVGERIGWMRSGGARKEQGSVLVLHGNAGSAVERSYLVEPIQAGTGRDVYVLEYPGFCGRSGKPSQESLTSAASEGLGLLAKAGPVFVVGESLGTGVACHLAGNHPEQVVGLILLTPFDSLTSTAKHHYPLLPVGWILRDRYPSDEWLRGYRGKVGIVVGTADRVVPAVLGRRLHAGYAGPKRLWEFEGEDHWEGSHRPPEWWREAFGFLVEPVP